MTEFTVAAAARQLTDPLRQMRNHAAVAIALLLAAAFTACGGEKQAATSTPPARAGAIPEDLKGIWEARIRKDELAVPHGDPEEPSVWTLKFLDTGGEDNGPSVFLSNDRAGELGGPISMSGRQITLESEPTCHTFRFEITKPVGDAAYPTSSKLYFESLDLSRCPSTPIGSVLTARGWTRPGAPAPDDEPPLERIRDEGSPGERIVIFPASGLTAREYVLCAGPRSECEKDPPLREHYEHRALEVTKGGRSALFRLADRGFLVTAFDETSVLALDNPHGAQDASGMPRYRRLRIDGTEVPLEMVMGPVYSGIPTDDWSLVPAIPGAGAVLIFFGEDVGRQGVQLDILVDERRRDLRPLDLTRNGFNPGLLPGRYWGPNPHEFPWFVYLHCRVEWVAGGTLQKRLLGCAERVQLDGRRHLRARRPAPRRVAGAGVHGAAEARRRPSDPPM